MPNHTSCWDSQLHRDSDRVMIQKKSSSPWLKAGIPLSTFQQKSEFCNTTTIDRLLHHTGCFSKMSSNQTVNTAIHLLELLESCVELPLPYMMRRIRYLLVKRYGQAEEPTEEPFKTEPKTELVEHITGGVEWEEEEYSRELRCHEHFVKKAYDEIA